MLTSRFLPFTLAAVALAGCATYQPKDINPASTQAQLESRSLREEGLRNFLAAHGKPAGEEWDLPQLTLAAFYFSPALDLARSQLAEAEAGVSTASARPNPSFDFTPGRGMPAAGVFGPTPWILGYALNIPIEVGGKRAYRTAQAQHQAEAARLSLASTAWATRSAVQRALTDLHAAEGAATIWRTQVPLLAEAARIVDTQVKAGEVSSFEVSQSRITLNQAELAARDSERALASARSRLAEAIGVPLAALLDIKISYPDLAQTPAPVAAAEMRNWAAQNRADLLGALATYRASEAALQSEIARQYPDLAFGPGYQRDQGNDKWTLSLGFTLPVFDQNQGPIAAAMARRESAAATFLELQNRVLAAVDRAGIDYASALGDVQSIKAMRITNEQQAKTIRAQQEAGESSRLDLLRAELVLADNDRAELDARIRGELALGELEDAVQHPLDWPEAAWRATPRVPAK